MAELAEYQHWLREGIKAGAAGDPRERYLAHLAQYDINSPFYGGNWQIGGALQFRANGQSNGRDIGDAIRTASGSELQAQARQAAGASALVKWLHEYDQITQSGQFDMGKRPESAADLDPRLIEQEYNERYAPSVSGLDANKRYAYLPSYDKTFGTVGNPNYAGGTVHEVADDFDPSRYAGYETVRPGELDNFVNGVKEQYGEAFDSAWKQQIEPNLRKKGAAGDLGAVYDKAKAQYMESGIPWKDLLKYDENVGLMAKYGSVKHVNDEGGGWNKYGGAWVKAAFAVAATLATAGQAAPMVGSAVAGATGVPVAGTIAAGATQGIAGNLIGSALTGTKVTGKGLATSALMGGVTPYANANLAQYITRPGTTALLETARQALTNRGKVDPRLVLATTAGNEAAHWAGDQFKNAGLAGKFVGGVAGGAVRQGISGGQVNPAALAFAGVGNTGAAGSMMARAASTYQRQQALRQYLQQRRGG